MASEEAPREEAQPLSVSAAMALAKGALEHVTVRLVGEVSQVNAKAGYKAVYFTVKDQNAALPCMMWNNRYHASGVELVVGQLVELTGRFSLYVAKGRMNFDVFSVALAGEGNLRLQVANLARKLEAEGLTSPERKLPVPLYPLRIGVVTSPRGAAVHDVLRTLRRRFPVAQVLLAGVPVEGANAPAGIVEGMRAVYRAGAEVVLVVRGGGSFEDLMPFNDETLARKIVQCPIPVVTGIGHEPDTSIADLVADLRTSTPTAAAEAVSPSRESLDALFAARTRSLAGGVERTLERAGAEVRRCATRPLFTDRNVLFAAEAQGIDYLADRLQRAIPAALARDEAALDRQRERLMRALPLAVQRDAHTTAALRDRLYRALPQSLARDTAAVAQLRDRFERVLPEATARQRAAVSQLGERFTRAMPQAVERRQAQVSRQRERMVAAGASLTNRFTQQFSLTASRLDDLSPLTVIKRGYAIAYGADGSVVKSVDAAPPGSPLDVTVADGVLSCRVEQAKHVNTETISWKDEQ